jgi:hypothetical protein
MSTVKITELATKSLAPNTANTIFVGVDLPSGVTGKYTAKNLADNLYANNILNVGNNTVVFPGVIGQFAGNNDTYLQVNLQNFSNTGSGDVVVTADTGTDTTYFIDMGFAGSDYTFTGDDIIKALDGYLLVQGSGGNPGGNLLVGTTTPDRDITFFLGGTRTDNLVAKFSYTEGFKLLNKPITFADGTTQNTSFAVTGTYANAAFLKANSAYESQNTTGDYANSAFLAANTPSHVANSAALYANGAFAKANAALANTSGTFGGNLTVSGNLIVSGASSSVTSGNLNVQGTSTLTGNVLMNAATYMAGAVTVNSTLVLANSNFSPTEAALTITASGNTVAPSNDGYMIHISGKNGVPSRLVTDSYGTNAYAVFAGRAARGTVDNPTALQANDVIARYSSSGYGTTKYQPFGVGRIDFVANENFTDANTGSRIEFWNCTNGSNTLNKIATFNGDSVHFTGVVAPEKGFLYTPRVLGAQTAITINFATDSMIRATFGSTLTMSFSNYTYGKVVEVWVTNTAGTGQTINLGVLANNSTTGSATLSVASNRSAKLQYFSIDGDLANTFCAITYA